MTLADVSGDGRTDILVANKLTGEVGVLRNLGFGTFAPVVFYRAGGGLYEVTNPGAVATLTTLEATTGVAAGAFTTGAPPDLVAINPGSNTMSMLSGLGGGRFANPVTLLTASPAIAVRVADLEGNGIPDLIVLSNSGVTVYRGDGKGGFLPDPFTIDAGPEPTGMTVADLNGDGKLDLLVSNAYGDLLVLLGNGDGTFQPYQSADQNVALAVLPNGSATPDFIYADQGLDQVVVDYASGQTNVVADQSSGLLAPGAVALADLNGDGIPDLIVANSGSNNVLVYPGLPNGQFGPELNGGNGFFTGTDPVGITVANLNGRPDLVIANEGSNDVSILLNVATADGGFTFVPGPRLQGGLGPTSTVVENVAGNPFPDLLVSDSGANQVRLLRGVGGGFFDDQDPTIYSVGSEPSQVMVGSFTPGQGPQILTVNRGSNDVTVISNFNGNAPVIQSFPTGGTDPVAVLGVDVAGNGLESLVVANSGDGLFTLLGNVGADGLEVEATLANSALPEPTALALDTVDSSELEFYAVTAGVDAALALAFILPESSAARITSSCPRRLHASGRPRPVARPLDRNVAGPGRHAPDRRAQHRAERGPSGCGRIRVAGRAERLDRATGNPVARPEFPHLHGRRRDRRRCCDFHVRADVLPIPWSGSRHGNRWDRRCDFLAGRDDVFRRPESPYPGQQAGGDQRGRRRRRASIGPSAAPEGFNLESLPPRRGRGLRSDPRRDPARQAQARPR